MKPLYFNQDQTYIFNSSHPNKKLHGLRCEFVNWNPPNIYTIDVENGTRMFDTEQNLKKYLVIESESIQPTTDPHFKIGDTVQSLKQRDQYIDSFSGGKLGTIVEIDYSNNPVQYHIAHHTYSVYGDETYYTWVDASEIKKIEETKLPDMNLILSEGMIVKLHDDDATYLVVKSDPYISMVNTDLCNCLLNLKTLKPKPLNEKQISKVWDIHQVLQYDANDSIITSLKRQVESIQAQIAKLESDQKLTS